MEWTRRPAARAAATAASAFLVVRGWGERDTWFWVGLVLLVLNLVGIAAHARRARGPAGAGAGVVDGGRGGATGGAAGGAAGGEAARDHGDQRLSAFLEVPEVAAAFADGPPQWRQVAYLDDEAFAPLAWQGVAEHVWVIREHDWHVGLDDELKPYLDLDLPEGDDPVLHVLLAHPAVSEAWHEDREVYTARTTRPVAEREFAALAARALVAHQRAAADRLA